MHFEQQINTFRKEKDLWMQNDPNSPILPADLVDFIGLYYYPYNSNIRYNGSIQVNTKQDVEVLEKEDGSTINLINYGSIDCDIEGKNYLLSAFKTITSDGLPDIAEGIFIPFKDVTSGNETCPSGRYLLIRPPRDGGLTHLDFNMAVNPFADYNNAYSGLITAPGNVIDTAMIGGERSFDDRTRGGD